MKKKPCATEIEYPPHNLEEEILPQSVSLSTVTGRLQSISQSIDSDRSLDTTDDNTLDGKLYS